MVIPGKCGNERHAMNTETQVAYDAEGYLIDPENWDESQAPDVRHVVDFLVREQGFEKKDAKQHLFNLFPYGYVKQACKIAGMQRPRAWSTG
jgi:sulfur relay (sulfurtransferase) DsrC/TusE family protein